MFGNSLWAIPLFLQLHQLSFKVESGMQSVTFFQQATSPRHAAPARNDVLTNGSRDENRIALTFDACPAPKAGGYDSAITRILVETGTPATLFLSGQWIKNHPAETKYLASLDQFEIGNHSYSHPHMKELSDSLMKRELRKTQELLRKLTGRKPTLFRPPYGEYDERVIKVVADFGLKPVEFDIASGDPDTTISAKRLTRYMTKNVRNGSIIVMHINKRGKHTAEALSEIIPQLKRKGFTFVKVSELRE